MRLLFPILLVIAAIGLFAAYINPTYQHIKILQAQSNQYDDALSQSTKLRQVRDDLLKKRNALTPDEVSKLETLLPNNVDNIRLIIDLTDLAAKYNLRLTGLSISAASAAGASGSIATGAPVDHVDVGFSISTAYPTFLSFLNDLEHSLRIIDIQKIQFGPRKDNKADYSFTLRTYWLK